MSGAWDEMIARLPDPHLLQTHEWGQVKVRNGWEPLYAAWDAQGGFRVERQAPVLATPAGAALILKKTINPRGFAKKLSILYVPKGPLLDWGSAALRGRILDDLQAFARKQAAIFMKIDPEVVTGTGLPGGEGDAPEVNGLAVQSELEQRGWLASGDQIQFRNTVILDLTLPESGLLGRMKQKTRYNVRLAEKKGVTVRTGTEADLPMLYRMYAETSVRDGFVIRDEAYYMAVWRTFMASDSPRCQPLIAEVEGEPVAAIFLFMFAGRAYYIHGMSREMHRERMPSYLLQWEAMKRAKGAGCRIYDLWGAPDKFNESDRMWGVYRFKEGLGGQVVRTLGAWDFAPSRFWYRMYAEVMPKLLAVMRSRGRAQTRQTLE